jgi:hypothetical protein
MTLCSGVKLRPKPRLRLRSLASRLLGFRADDLDEPERREPLSRVQDPAEAGKQRPPRARRVAIVSVVLLALVGAGIGISVAVSGGGHKTRSAATSTEHPHTPQLPARAVSLPAIEPGGLGVLKILQPSQRTLTSAQALKAYRRILASLILQGRTVKTTLAGVAYIEHAQEHEATVWIISVWYHAPTFGVSPQRPWCVAHQLIYATSGRAWFQVNGCLPSGRRPVSVRD